MTSHSVPYPVADIRHDLAYVEGRIDEWTAAGSHTESLAKYKACAAELHALLAEADGTLL